MLYHFTSGQRLASIAAHGLTVGYVATDVARWEGTVGVWLTSDAEPEGHGLAPGCKQFRLAVDLPDESPQLVRWSEWAPRNVTPETIAFLNNYPQMLGQRLGGSFLG